MSIRIWLALCVGLTVPLTVSCLTADGEGPGPWVAGPLLRRDNFLNSAVAFTPDGSVALTLGATTMLTDTAVLIEQRQASTGAVLGRIGEPHGVSSYDLAVLPDNVSLLYGLATDDEKGQLQAGLKIVHASTGSQRKSVLVPGFISRLALSGDGKKAIVAVERGDDANREVEIQLWDVTALKLLRTLLKAKDSSVSDVAFSRDSAAAAAGLLVKTDNGLLVETTVWDTVSGEMRRTFRGAERHLWGVLAFSPDGKRLALTAGGPNGDTSRDSLIIRRIDTGALEQTLVMQEGFATAAEFSSDAKYLAAVGAVAEGEPKQARNGILNVWETESGKLIQKTVEPGFPIKAIAFSPDGTRIAVAGYSSKDEASRAAYARIYNRAAKTALAR